MVDPRSAPTASEGAAAPRAVLLSTNLIAEVAERRSQGERAVLDAHAETLRRAGVGCVVERVAGDSPATTLFPTEDVVHTFHPPRPYNPSHVKRGLRLVEHLHRDLADSRPTWRHAVTAAGIVEAEGNGQLAMVLGLDGSTPLEDDPVILEVYRRLGVRLYGLAHQAANAVTGTYCEDVGHGLSNLGVSFAGAAQRLGILLDGANLSQPGFWDLIDLLDGPCIVSSGNPRSLCDHPANLSEDQLRAIADTGGVVGVGFDPHRLADDGRPTIHTLVGHVDALVATCGIDHVGIGFAVVEEGSFPRGAYDRIVGSEAARSVPEDDVSRRGFNAIDDLRSALARAGYTMEDVDKVFRANALRVFAGAWGG